LKFEDSSKFKTHCATHNGEVLLLTYDGLPLAGGHNYFRGSTQRSGFSLLWDGVGDATDSYSLARRIMEAVNARTHGALLVQRLSDLRNGVPSTQSSLCGIALTNKSAIAGDLREFLPAAYFAPLNTFLERFSQLVPDIYRDDSVLYAPAIEWWMRRIDVVSRHLETARSGIYVCGDGSGWSQGIVHAAATGLLVSEGISGCAFEFERFRKVADSGTLRFATYREG
jgi:uncharacterized FAD-dependent dehydrogenase